MLPVVPASKSVMSFARLVAVREKGLQTFNLVLALLDVLGNLENGALAVPAVVVVSKADQCPAHLIRWRTVGKHHIPM